MPAAAFSITEVASFDGLRIPVNVYLPEAAVRGGAGRLPVIVFMHGGPPGWSTVEWNPLTRLYVSQGYAVVEPNIRGSSRFGRAFQLADNGAKRPDSFKDMEAVGRWAVEFYVRSLEFLERALAAPR